MILDTSIVSLSHIAFFAVAFILSYNLLSWLLNRPDPILRSVPKKSAYYAGSIVIGAVALLAYIVLEDPLLKVGLLGASFLCLLIGIIDENRPLSPQAQLAWQVVIATVAVAWGWTIRYVSDPYSSGVIDLATGSIGPILLPGSILAVAWLVLLMNSINWLDGVDGQAGGVGVVALLTLSGVSLLPSTQDSLTLTLSLIGAGAVLGFLIWNFPPARVYLGTSGSWFLGLFIGMVAIIGGGKIVTTLLVLALPVIDMALVIVQRLAQKKAPWIGDRENHLHFRLVSWGWSHRAIAIAAISLTSLLGLAAITLQTSEKIIALIIASVMLGAVTLHLFYRQSKQV